MTTTKVQASKWTPSLSVSAPSTATTGVQIAGSSFTATLTNSAPGATGTIHIKYVQAGSARVLSARTGPGTASATGDGNYSQSNALTPSATTYWWWAIYDGDAATLAATSTCGSMTSSTVGLARRSSPDDDEGHQRQREDRPGRRHLRQGARVVHRTLHDRLDTDNSASSGGTLSSTTSSASTATLTIAEGSGAANTAVGTFTLALASSSGIVDTSNRHGSFAAAAPADGAGPVPISMSSTNKPGGTAGKAEAGDTVAVTFSEPISTIGGATTSAVTLNTTNGNGKPVTMTLPNLGNGSGFTIGNKDNYLSGNSANATFGPQPRRSPSPAAR